MNKFVFLRLTISILAVTVFGGCQKQETTKTEVGAKPSTPSAPARVTKQAALAAISTNVILPTLSAFT